MTSYSASSSWVFPLTQRKREWFSLFPLNTEWIFSSRVCLSAGRFHWDALRRRHSPHQMSSSTLLLTSSAHLSRPPYLEIRTFLHNYGSTYFLQKETRIRLRLYLNMFCNVHTHLHTLTHRPTRSSHTHHTHTHTYIIQVFVFVLSTVRGQSIRTQKQAKRSVVNKKTKCCSLHLQQDELLYSIG